MVQIIKGDEVSIRGVIVGDNNGGERFSVHCDTGHGIVDRRALSLFIDPAWPCVTHHPAPREIKAGSIVRHKSQGGEGETQEILFRDREDCVYRGYRCLMTVNVNQLEWVGQREDAKA